MLNVKQIRAALTRLGALAYRDHIDLEVFLVGGSAIALAYGTRDSTQDVDAVIVRPEDKRKLYGLIQQVAEEQGLDAKWLNEAAARYVTRRSDGPVVLQSRGITVRHATAAQLLGMKLMAWRSITDQQDSRDILRHLIEETGAASVDDVWEMIKAYVLANKITQARDNLDDIWQEAYG